jgi:hypothetical protein
MVFVSFATGAGVGIGGIRLFNRFFLSGVGCAGRWFWHNVSLGFVKVY